jgi:hypothetical protein
MFVPYLNAGHTNSGEAMTMGRMIYVALSMALSTKVRQGNMALEGINIHVTSSPAGCDSTRMGAMSFGI